MDEGDASPTGPKRLLQAAAAVALVLLVFFIVSAADDGGEETVTAASSVSRPADLPRGPPPEGEPTGDATSEREPMAVPTGPAGSPVVQVREGRSVAILDSPGGKLVAKQGDETEFGSPTVFSVQRQKGRWLGISTQLVPNGQLGWIRDGSRDLRAGSVDHSVLVDLSERSALLLEGGERIRSWEVTIGAPGSETPTGTFAVTDTIRGGLNPAYGCCAVALSATQPNIPQGWAGGDRIAFHGTYGPIGAALSKGCVRSANRDVSALLETAPLGTPVTIRE